MPWVQAKKDGPDQLTSQKEVAEEEPRGMLTTMEKDGVWVGVGGSSLICRIHARRVDDVADRAKDHEQRPDELVLRRPIRSSRSDRSGRKGSPASSGYQGRGWDRPVDLGEFSEQHVRHLGEPIDDALKVEPEVPMEDGHVHHCSDAELSRPKVRFAERQEAPHLSEGVERVVGGRVEEDGDHGKGVAVHEHREILHRRRRGSSKGALSDRSGDGKDPGDGSARLFDDGWRPIGSRCGLDVPYGEGEDLEEDVKGRVPSIGSVVERLDELLVRLPDEERKVGRRIGEELDELSRLEDRLSELAEEDVLERELPAPSRGQEMNSAEDGPDVMVALNKSGGGSGFVEIRVGLELDDGGCADDERPVSGEGRGWENVVARGRELGEGTEAEDEIPDALSSKETGLGERSGGGRGGEESPEG
jgi:hypothetical protein